MTTKTILILGGGIGGIVAARELRRHLGHEHRIVLVDKNFGYSFAPSYLWLTIGWRQPEAIERSLHLLERHQIEFHQGTVTEIRFSEKKVVTEHATLSYDYLIIALGAELDSMIHTSKDANHFTFYTKTEALRLKDKIASFANGTIAIAIQREPYSFPPAPYEAAFLFESFFAQRNIGNITIKLFTPERSPLHFLGPDISKIFSRLLTERNIEIHPAHQMASVDKDQQQINFSNNHSSPYDILIHIPAHRPPAVIANSSISNPDGWVTINKMMQTSAPNVFALGDVAFLAKENGERLPMTGVFTLNQAEIVAYNIAHEIQKNSLRKEFTGSGFLIVELGHGRACNIHGDFLASQPGDLIFNEPNVTIHWGKVVIEKYWLWRWF